MTKRLWNLVLVLAYLLGVQSARAEFKDFKLNLEGEGILSAEEVAGQKTVSFGIIVNSDGTLTRVDATDASANAVFNGRYNNDHGCVGVSLTFAVDGPVKIGLGTCQYGNGDAPAFDSDGKEVLKINSNDGTCFHGDREKNIVYGVYKGGATTLTLKPGNYTPFISVAKAEASDLVEDHKITFGFGSYEGAGILPAELKVEEGKTFTVPANFTMYQEGKTLVSWTDGSKNYEIGEIVTVAADMALTPVFVDNAVTLADRTDAVTLRWDFQRQNGAPVVGFEGVSGFWVTQVKIGTEVIDVKLDFDTRNGGKIANANWNDWAQMNSGTTFKVPSCKGAVVSTEAYSAPTTTTVDGIAIGNGSTQPSFTCQSKAEFVDLVIGDGSYYRFVQVMLPYVPKDLTGTSFDNKEASVVWAFNSADYMTDLTITPESTFSIANFDIGECNYKKVITTTMCPDVKFVDIASFNGPTDIIKWCVKPVKGLKFTPVSISFYIGRDGTDGAGKDVTVKGEISGSDVVETFATITPHRNNKTQADDKHGADETYTTKFEYTLTPEQQKALTSGEGFNLVMNNGYANTKGLLVSDVHINGVLNGTVEAVEKFSLKLSANIEDGGKITAYPAAEEYEEGTEVKLTAARNFGYKFVNWTDAAGKEVSAEPVFVYKVNANSELIANFEQIKTYSLDYSVDGGAKLYMVTPTPEPVVIDGRNMYEEGTTVTLAAASNPVVAFTNWSDGQSSSEISIVMDADKVITANYSAVDFLAGWDFVRKGNDGRAADFASADNDAAALVLRNADGTTTGWLDKSLASDKNGYEGRPGAVNWRTTGLGEYYWQTMVNAEAFTDLKVITAMVYNYNAYQKYNVEYSLDGENWKPVGTIFMEGTKKWTDGEFTLPAEANNQKTVYIRWIADKNSEVDGTVSDNDGACLGATYITGTSKLIDDGTAPVLVSFVPAEGSTTASINGKIVLTFDEKVKVKEGTKATLGDLTLTPSVTGKTVMFQYKNLAYNSKYTFSLPAGSVSDLTDNALKDAITINFTTKNRPTVAKALFDAEVSTVDELLAAIKAASSRDDKTKRFRIFIHDGEYRIPASATATKLGTDEKEYPDPTTYINVPNISFIGESVDGVVITNTLPDKPAVMEGIGRGDVLSLEKNATGTYFQNLTMKSSMGDGAGRDIVLNDKSDKTVMKDVCLWAYQDTYVSNNERSRFYFEGGLLRGCTDFLCGKGDVYYNAVTLQMCGEGGYLAVPSVPKKYGYIFKDCEIVGESEMLDGNYTLGRPWGKGTPIALFIDTKMTVKPSAAGWNEMGDGWPARFAEYNSMTANGTVIDLGQRKKIFSNTHENNPVLTKEEADAVSYEVVMGGDDDWDPASATEQAPAPANVKFENGLLTWDDSDYASCWAVCKNGKVIAFTVEPKFDVTTARADEAVYSVRAANEMGGLGEAVGVGGITSGSCGIYVDEPVVSTVYYNLQGIRVDASAEGVLIRVDTLESGRTVTTKVLR